MSPILGIWASQNYPRVTTSFESIATVTVGSGGAATATFSSIPSDYTHLQIRTFTRNTSDQYYIRIRVNSDSGSNYANHRLSGNGTAASAASNTSDTYAYLYPQTATATTFGGGVIDILDYKNANKYKTFRALGGYDQNGDGRIELNSGLWMSTSAITSIVLDAFAGNFAQYSSFALYGIRSA